MAGLHLEKGDQVDLNGRRYTCAARGPGGAFLLAPENSRSGTRYLKPEALFDLTISGALKLVKDVEPTASGTPDFQFDISVLKECERDQVLMRVFYMDRLDKHREAAGTLSNSALENFAAQVHQDYVEHCRKENRNPPEKPMSPSAIRRWFRRWVDTGGKSLALSRDARGNGHTKLSTEQAAFLDAAISNDYLTKKRLTAKATHKLLTARIIIENRERARKGLDPIPAPHYNTLCRHIAAIDLYEKLAARYSAAYAQKVTRHHGVTPPTHRHLQSVQFDHTLLDLYCDFGEGILIRPWLTMILDRYSKAILGFWITPDPPSAESVMQALRMAVLPKNLVMLGGDGDWPWPMHGIPSELVCDNGKEFHGLDLEVAAADLQIILSFAPPRQPYYKSQIERKFGEVNTELLSQLPGQVFKYEPTTHKLDYPHLTFEALKRIFIQWVTTVLHREPLADGSTPEERWLESVAKHGTPGSGFTIDFINSCIAKVGGEQPIHGNGIRFNSTKYSNPWLTQLRNELSATSGDGKAIVKFKWSAHDVGSIWVLDPKAHAYMLVESSEKATHGRSLYNHRVVLRERRNRRAAKMSDDTYIDAVLALDQAIKDQTKRKPGNKASGTRVARYTSGQPKPPMPRTEAPERPRPMAGSEPIIIFADDLLIDTTPAIEAPRPQPLHARSAPPETIQFEDSLEF